MNMDEMMSEIKEANLTYLMLAQHMIRKDKAAAMYRLGIGQDIADILQSLTASQILKMASSNMMLCRLRFDDQLVLSMLAGYGKEKTMAQSHAAILLSGQPVENIA